MRILIIPVFLFLFQIPVRAACNEMSLYQQSKWKEIIGKQLTKAEVDVDHDGTDEVVDIFRESGGEYLLDAALKPHDYRDCGWFKIRVFKGDKMISSQSLNYLLNNNNNDDVSFRRSGAYHLIIKDYNKDEQPDFSIGVYAGPKTNKYKVFTINPAGEIQQLQFIDARKNNIDWVVINDTRFSTDKFEMKGDLIKTHYNYSGAGGTTSWKWNGKDFGFISFKADK